MEQGLDMQQWVRFEHQGQAQLGLLQGEQILVHHGDLYNGPQPTGVTLPLSAVRLLRPVQPTKVIASTAAKMGIRLSIVMTATPDWHSRNGVASVMAGLSRSTVQKGQK